MLTLPRESTVVKYPKRVKSSISVNSTSLDWKSLVGALFAAL